MSVSYLLGVCRRCVHVRMRRGSRVDLVNHTVEDMTFGPAIRNKAEAMLEARNGKENLVDYEFVDYKGLRCSTYNHLAILLITHQVPFTDLPAGPTWNSPTSRSLLPNLSTRP
jgi:hypothetical protein